MYPLARFVAAAGAVLVLQCLPAAAQDDAVAPVEPMILVTDMPPPEVVKGYLQLGFDRLSGYEFVLKDRPVTGKPTQAAIDAGIPAVVRSWSGKRAEITGFMVPTRMEKGLVVEFILVRDMNSCCYGVSPALNHYVIVKVPKGTPALMGQVVKVSGTFRVNTTFDTHGYIAALYEVAGEKVVATEE